MAIEFSKEEWMRHAKYELGLVNEDPIYLEFYLKVIEAYCDFPHDERTLYFTPETLEKLFRHKNLSYLTNHEAEWYQVAEGVWKNKRNPLAISNDGGRSFVEFPPFDTNMNTTLMANTMPPHIDSFVRENLENL